VSPKNYCNTFCRQCLVVLLMAGALAWPAAASTPADRGQWMGNIGQSGLRGVYSSGGDLGELVNRAVSYQLASRRLTQAQAQDSSVRPVDIQSRVESYVTQNDSLLPLQLGQSRPLYLRTQARVAWRDERGSVSSRNDRVDLGVLYAPSQFSYVSVGLAGEATQSTIKFVDGRSTGQAWGPRLDAGVMVNSTWALALRLDRMQYGGASRVFVASADGPLTVRRDLDYRRHYLSLDAVARADSQSLSWLPDGMQLRAQHSLQMLHNRYSQQLDSLGRVVVEPFGNRERLALLRSGGGLSQSLGADRQWLLSAALNLDYEFSSNMKQVIDDRAQGSASLSMTRLFRPGQRLMFEYERYQSSSRQRVRNNYSVIAVFDF